MKRRSACSISVNKKKNGLLIYIDIFIYINTFVHNLRCKNDFDNVMLCFTVTDCQISLKFCFV